LSLTLDSPLARAEVAEAAYRSTREHGRARAEAHLEDAPTASNAYTLGHHVV
jgi:hypothetical protein